MKAKYVYVSGMLVGKIDENDELFQYFHDGLVSITMISDSMGSYENLYTYDDFGNFRLKSENVSNSYCYTGQERDEEPSGLYNLRARYYAPGIGRFTQEDPVLGIEKEISSLGCSSNSDRMRIVTNDTLDNNRYLYARSNPIMFTDFTGEFCGPGKIGEWAFPVPNKYPFFDFTEACRKHDECYASFCGVSKSNCDQQFLQNMRNECGKVPKALYIPNPITSSCYGLAQIYYNAVESFLGSLAYSISQSKACKCK